MVAPPSAPTPPVDPVRVVAMPSLELTPIDRPYTRNHPPAVATALPEEDASPCAHHTSGALILLQPEHVVSAAAVPGVVDGARAHALNHHPRAVRASEAVVGSTNIMFASELWSTSAPVQWVNAASVQTSTVAESNPGNQNKEALDVILDDSHRADGAAVVGMACLRRCIPNCWMTIDVGKLTRLLPRNTGNRVSCAKPTAS